MFGNLIGNSSDHQRNVLNLINNPNISDAQKAAYCYDQGCCETCGIKTVFVGPFKRRPLTNDRVLNGVCRTCYPDQCNLEMDRPSAAAPWDKMQKFVVPPEALLAKTSGAFTSLQTSVTKGIHNIKSTDMTEKSKTFTDETSKAFSALHASVTGGINTLNENIKKNSDTINGGMIQSSVTRGITDMKTRRLEERRKKESLSSLKHTFAPDELGLKAETNDNKPEDLKGSSVLTPYGRGIVRGYRPEDNMFEIELISAQPNDSTNTGTKTTKLFCKRESFNLEMDSKNREKESMELNEAYESLEKMRRLNLELECQERGVVVDYSKCTQCLLNPEQDKPQNFPRIRKLMKNQATSTSCLFCAAPTCPQHSCANFRKEGITACSECVKLFEPDYIVACLHEAHGLSEEMSVAAKEGKEFTPTEDQPLEMMMDLYDRVLLLLRYSSQYIESIAMALEDMKKTYNSVNVTASSTGILSGALGVAAAATLFTPAGAPLLIASLTLGAGATAAQTGTEAVNFFSEPNKFADKILALIGMVHSILKVHSSLRDILTARLLAQEGNPEIDRLRDNLVKLRAKQTEAVVKSGVTFASTAILGSAALSMVEAGGVASVASVAVAESAAMGVSLEVGAVAGRQATMMSKSATAAARGARFARCFGGALSAATILLEARTLKKTTEQIRLGNPCEKANALRSVLKEIPTLPTTDELDEECRIYVGALSNRVNTNSLEDAINLIERQAMREWQTTKDKLEELAPEQVSILDGETDDESDWDSVTGVLAASINGHSTSALETCQNDSNSSASAPMAQSMAQSMPQLPGQGADPQRQAALLDRIKKFKEADSR